MPGFDHLDAARRQSVPVASDDKTFERCARGPMPLDRKRHRSGGLARADDQRPTRWRGGKMTREDLERIGGGDGGLEALYEQLLRFHASSLGARSSRSTARSSSAPT